MPTIKLPVTRYYGSKRKLVSSIWNEINKLELQIDSVLDIFGGSSIFSYYSKSLGKSTIYNDSMKFNYFVANALIVNEDNPLSLDEALGLLKKTNDFDYKNTIAKNYQEIYYPDEENELIDTIAQNIMLLPTLSKKAAAYYLLIQSCLIKRPYNLFHRKNLNLRTNFRSGTFGNKVTWERSFEELFSRFHDELSRFTFGNGRCNSATNTLALECCMNADLVYIDPPYFRIGKHETYHSKYHFLEGLVNYNEIETNIDFIKNNHEIVISKSNQFEERGKFIDDMNSLINLHQNSVIAISYRNNGVPTIEQLTSLVRQFKNNVRTINLGNHSYALNRNNSDNFEYLIIGF